MSTDCYEQAMMLDPFEPERPNHFSVNSPKSIFGKSFMVNVYQNYILNSNKYSESSKLKYLLNAYIFLPQVDLKGNINISQTSILRAICRYKSVFSKC